MGPSKQELLASARQFSNAFSQKEDIAVILSYFSTTHQVSVIEHGEPSLAPFLGRTFTGLAGARQYFETINALITYENMIFSEFFVDTDVRKVAMKGRAKFTWLSTGESWNETFAYVLDFDDEAKVTEYQIWADSGAAYLARIGELTKIRDGAE